MDLEQLVRFPLPVLRQALGLARGIMKRTNAGAYDEVAYILEQAIKQKEQGGS